MLGDKRWAGTYGVDADYWAEDNCRVLYILTSDILVREGRISNVASIVLVKSVTSIISSSGRDFEIDAA
jgi:hypothetical protein